MLVQQVHHVAYRCIDAKQTVEWYGKMLNMGFVLAIAEDQVPSRPFRREPRAIKRRPKPHQLLNVSGDN